MSLFNKNVRRFRRVLNPDRPLEIYGRTGLLDDNGNVYEDPAEDLDEPGMIWFRQYGSGGEAFAVINTRVSNRKADLPVVCRWIAAGQVYAVREIDPVRGPRELGDMMGVYNRPDAPSEANQRPLANAYLKELRVRLDEAGGFNIYIEPGFYRRKDGTLEYFEGETVDLSAFQPSEELKTPVLVGIDEATNAAATFAGTDADFADLPVVAPYFDGATWAATVNAATGADTWLFGIPILGTDTGFTSTDRFVNLRVGVDMFGLDQTAFDVPYTETDPADWPMPPGDVGAALDILADEVATLIATGTLSEPYVHLQEQLASGTNGGQLTQNTWNIRNVNTEVTDTDGLCSAPSGGAFTLQAGTWRIHASAPGKSCGAHRIRLYNVTDSAVVLEGANAYQASTALSQSHSVLRGVFTLSAAKSLRIEHNCLATKPTDGMGVPDNLGSVEIYTDVEFYKRF